MLETGRKLPSSFDDMKAAILSILFILWGFVGLGFCFIFVGLFCLVGWFLVIIHMLSKLYLCLYLQLKVSSLTINIFYIV